MFMRTFFDLFLKGVYVHYVSCVTMLTQKQWKLIEYIRPKNPNLWIMQTTCYIATFTANVNYTTDYFEYYCISVWSLLTKLETSILLTTADCFIISLQFLSTVEKRRPSSGIWAMISGELKMGSRYNQVACTLSHSSRISCRRSSLNSQSLDR